MSQSRLVARLRATLSHILTATLLAIVAVPSLQAHKLAPSLLSLQQQSGQAYAVSWKTPRFSSTPVPIEPHLPAICSDRGERTWAYEGTGVRVEWRIECSASLHGSEISVSGLAENQSAALLRIAWDDGVVTQGMLNAENPRFRIPEQPSGTAVVRDYLLLGVQHILGGVDHLLFVLGLLLLATSTARLVWTITSFTLGHSLTLALAALGYLRYPVDLIEFAIALSIFVVAVELTRENTDRHFLRRRPWLAAASFGLLHGMGFAGALLETGLPPHDIPLALLFFNVGIEAGQLLFIAAVVVAGRIWNTVIGSRLVALRWAPVYLIGCGSAYWCFERGSAAFLGG